MDILHSSLTLLAFCAVEVEVEGVSAGVSALAAIGEKVVPHNSIEAT